MKYRIKSSLIESSWFEETIFKTLDMYEAGENLMDSPLAEFQRNYESWGGRHESLIGKDLEVGIKERFVDFIKLYEDIKQKGFNTDVPFFVYFDDDGFIRLYDGHHRLSIIRYLNYIKSFVLKDPDVLVSTDWDSAGIDPHGYKGRDFPLASIARSIFGREEMYQRIPDERLAHFKVQRPDSKERLQYLMDNVIGETVLDIGCSEGYFCHELAKEGYDVTGIENGYKNDRDRGRKLLAITRYLATIQSVKMKCVFGDWKDLIREHDMKFDSILYLSVLHNEINALGAEQAFEDLRLFRGKCQRLFVEIPNIEKQKDWAEHFEIEKVCTELERETGMKVKEVWQGYRPIILLTNELKKTTIKKK